MKSGAKRKNWGRVGRLGGQSRSSAMSPFDAAHTTYYLTLIETVRLSHIVFGRKLAILTHPTCI